MLSGFEDGRERLLEIPAIPNGKGETIAKAMHEVIEKNDVAPTVAAICMDTTAANSGRHIGAGILLEKRLGRAVLYPYCCHHKLECVQGAAFTTAVSKTTGPQNTEFKKFQSVFPHLLLDSGELHDQADAKWIVIRGLLKGHNDMRCGRPTPGWPISCPGVGHP